MVGTEMVGRCSRTYSIARILFDSDPFHRGRMLAGKPALTLPSKFFTSYQTV